MSSRAIESSFCSRPLRIFSISLSLNIPIIICFFIVDIVLFFIFVVRITLQLCKCYINSYTNIIVVTIITIIKNVFFVLFIYRCRKDHASPHQTPDQEVVNLQAEKMKTPVPSSSSLYMEPTCLQSVPDQMTRTLVLPRLIRGKSGRRGVELSLYLGCKSTKVVKCWC